MESQVRILLLKLFILLNLQISKFVSGQNSLFGFQETLNEGSPCYEMLSDGTSNLHLPLMCQPPLRNVVAEAKVVVDPPEMTCGVRNKARFCQQTGGYYKECQLCDANDPELSHNPDYLTDIHLEERQTSWQSVTMNEQVQYTRVNLTVNLRKAFDIIYLRLKFSSSRPETFAIYKKTRFNASQPDPQPDEGWIPWQYYSAACRDTFGVPDSLSIIQPNVESSYGQKINEDRALCTSEFSDISPLTGGNIAFSTLEGRPGADNFNYNRELQHWVTATDIRISLMRLNTFGDEVFMDPKVLESYYYGVTHFQVGGRCKCNGHSNVCIPKDPDNDDSAMICLCKHGTTGDDCDRCLPDHWDVPWRRATKDNPNPCQACDCNDWSTRCHFSEELYQTSGGQSGGMCDDCGGNRDGPHCQFCLSDHYISPIKDSYGRQPCIACDCDPEGSLESQCSDEGKCKCKEGVTGDKCDKCEANYWKFPEEADSGCLSCNCKVEGSYGNRPSCNTDDGQCSCKQNVEGQQCDRCMSGHFEIDFNNEFGCTPCFCYGHTSRCLNFPGWVESKIISDFSRGPDAWGSDEYGLAHVNQTSFDPFNKMIRIQSVQNTAYFTAPERYIGDQKASYNKDITFSLKTGPDEPSSRPSNEDIVIEGGGDIPTKLTLQITSQGNPLPGREAQVYKFRLHENPEFGWRPSLRAKDFIAVLSNIKSIKIRGTYMPQGMGFLDEVVMGSAEIGIDGKPSTVEWCECPPAYKGQFCESCERGNYHENNAGPFARCIPCNCHGHSDYCDEETGVCDCQHNTGGVNCQMCATGYYGDAVAGTPDDCQMCPCPYVQNADGSYRNGACYEIEGVPESPICSECPPGRIGSRCELCMDGYFGDPEGLNGQKTPCQRCQCYGNIDLSNIGNCNRTTGECLRCIDDTDGFNCEKCKPGYFGDALAPNPKPGEKNCNPCGCHPFGTEMQEEIELPVCNGITGKCKCKQNVAGHNCDQCQDGYWNLNSMVGCEACNCHPVGSIDSTCDDLTGQCHCREGIEGKHCDQLQPLHFAFSLEGGQRCDCDPTGSLSDQCDIETGQCPCREKVEGRKCDTCMENTKTRDGYAGEKICEPCEDCYGLIQDVANEHRRDLKTLETLLKVLEDNPEPVGDEQFDIQLKKLKYEIRTLIEDANRNLGNEEGGTLRDRLEELMDNLDNVKEVVDKANTQLDDAMDKGDGTKLKIQQAENDINTAKDTLMNAKTYLDNKGREALRDAEGRARKFGESNNAMTSIATEARRLATQQMEDASEIESIANQANMLAMDAWNNASSAVTEKETNAEKIGQLQSKLFQISQQLESVEMKSQIALKEAKKAHNRAMFITQKNFNLEVPKIDDDKMETNSDIVKKDAERIKEEADRLLSINAELIQETMDKRAELLDLLYQAEQQQTKMDKRKKEISDYDAEAVKAVELGNTVLEKAQETLKTLQEFGEKVNENKAKAEEAQGKIQDIDDMVNQANLKTEEATRNLESTDQDSITAEVVAADSKNMAELASGNASEIVKDADTRKEEAEQLKNNAMSLEEKYKETQEKVTIKEEVAAINANLATEALRGANKALSNSIEASEKVANATQELDDISGILASLDNPDESLLDELEALISKAEIAYNEAQLEERLQELEDAKQKQIAQKSDLNNEYETVKAEVETIEEILNTLPEFCPNAIEHGLEI